MSCDDGIIRQRPGAAGVTKRRSPDARSKIIDPEHAARLIFDGDTPAIGGFVGMAVPEALLIALAERFDQTGGPRDLTLVFTAGQGDGGARGLNRFAREDRIRRAIGAHWGLVPGLGALVLDARIEAYCLPLGVMSHLYRETAAGRPGLITRVGLGTFVDPSLDGGRMKLFRTRKWSDRSSSTARSSCSIRIVGSTSRFFAGQTPTRKAM